FSSPRYVPHLHLHSFPTRRSSDLTLHQKTGTKKPPGASTPGGFYFLNLLSERMPQSNGFHTIRTGGNNINRRLNLLFQEADIGLDRKSTRLNSSHVKISYAVFCLK